MIDAFVAEYVLRRRPVVIRGGAKGWKLRKRWTLAKLRVKYGHVRLPAGSIPYFEMFGKAGVQPTLAEFLDSHNAGWWAENYESLIAQHGARVCARSKNCLWRRAITF